MISIIIPTLNEVENLQFTITNALSAADTPDLLEVIVVDAGSTDGTLKSVSGSVARLFSKPAFALKKYESLNYGLKKSSGEIVLFLDADTLLPNHFDTAIVNTLSSEEVVGGAFDFAFDKPDFKLSILTLINRVRYRIDKVYYGDQAIFAKKDELIAIGGVPKKTLMEAAYLCKSLKKRGKLSLLQPGITTSVRRFNTNGFFKVTWFDFHMFIRFNLGLSVSGYAKKYWSKNLTK